MVPVPKSFWLSLRATPRASLRAAGEPAAPVVILSKAQRAALVACLAAGTLSKQRGRWFGLDGAAPIAGVTVADDLLNVTIGAYRCVNCGSLCALHGAGSS